jgi:GMP synthase-like glutamine amidotransferase
MSKKLVLIMRFYKTEGPGYLADFFSQNDIHYQLVKVDQMENIPKSISEYAGLVLMGGPMSVNDGLPWINEVVKLIQEAIHSDVPVLGHCLGGQLISKAVGATVKKNSCKEIGWFEVQTLKHTPQQIEATRKWFGDLSKFEVFHWHGETFELPQNAIHLLTNKNCHHQAYSYLDKHMAFQCHIEMTPSMVESWIKSGANEMENEKNKEAIQSPMAILENVTNKCDQLNKLASRVYKEWSKGLRLN